jgi:predicted transposase YdaD
MPYITTGERIGYDRGKVEERQAIARNLLRQGIMMETIAQATGLSMTQLQQLQTESQSI